MKLKALFESSHGDLYWEKSKVKKFVGRGDGSERSDYQYNLLGDDILKPVVTIHVYDDVIRDVNISDDSPEVMDKVTRFLVHLDYDKIHQDVIDKLPLSSEQRAQVHGSNKEVVG